jgi:MYXO-CTERM domain-containing protein
MQITVTPGSSLSMTFNLTTGAPGGIIQDIFSQTVIIWPAPPAPGTLAILGLAGLVRRSRRRV